MKRISIVWISLLVCLLLGLPCFAATLTKDGETVDIDVYVKKIRDLDGATAPVEQGEASVTLEDGTRVTVSDIQELGLWLVVYPIPEEDTEAWNWFERCLAPYGTNLYPMEIYFVDQDGNRVEVSGTFSVAVKISKPYKDPFVCYLTREGSVNVLDSRTEGTTYRFSMSRSGYYVLAEKKTGSNDPEQPGNDTGSKANGSSGAKTGDDSNLWLWICVCAGSLFVAGWILRKKNEE